MFIDERLAEVLKKQVEELNDLKAKIQSRKTNDLHHDAIKDNGSMGRLEGEAERFASDEQYGDFWK